MLDEDRVNVIAKIDDTFKRGMESKRATRDEGLFHHIGSLMILVFNDAKGTTLSVPLPATLHRS